MNKATPNIPEILSNHGYQIVQCLENKYFPSVLLVYSSSFNENYVCKVVTKRIKYEKEIHALTVLDHPNIIRLYSHFEDSDTFFLILEYCQGGSLEDLIKHHARPKQDKIINYTKQIVAALKYIHSKNIVHHDLKPSNILFDKYGCIKIADFGLSCAYKQNSSNYYVGSYGYLSPEQRANHVFDPFVADIWSLGVTIYFMTCGFNPFLQQKNGLKIFIPMYVEKTLVNIITGTLEEDPSKRISLNDIQAYLLSNPKLTIPSTSWYGIPAMKSIEMSPKVSQIRPGKSTIIRV